ncbi:MAG: hypothetical protein KDA24_04805, partial [Deltaproteobacteria bacterium]|nr:hypothetical protein [Deltaproteobacteria bacterium]
LNALPALALIAVLAARGGRASLGSAAAVAGVTGGVAALLFWPLGLSPLGWDPGGLGSFPADGPRWERAIDTLHFAWVRGLDGVRLGDDLGRTHRVLLLLGVLGAALSWMPARESSPPSPGADARVARRDIARFASLWAVLALAAPVLTGNGTPRYFIPAFAACTLSLASHLSSSRHGLQAVAGGALLALAVLGGREVTPLIDPGVWSREMPRHDLWFVLELDTLDADELPYYRRILTEGRGSPWVGRSSHHASNRCGRWPGTGPGHAPPDIDHCQGWGPGELATVVADVQRRTTEADRRRALMDLGRGAWIRSNRALAEVARAIEGTDPTLAEPVLAGARDEARRWQDR